MRRQLTLLLVISTVICGTYTPVEADRLSPSALKEAFERESIAVSEQQIATVQGKITIAVEERCTRPSSGGNSKTVFTAVEVASALGLNPKVDTSLVNRIERVLDSLPCEACLTQRCTLPPRPTDSGWDEYFTKTVGLMQNHDFMKLLAEKAFHPVKISWEDIGRYKNSVWGDRISDVGIWVRRTESDPASADLALSVRRDSNFRDKVLVVPTEKIKIHLKEGDTLREVSLRDRLRELGLTSKERDDNVIVSNQFSIVPVPAATTNREDNPSRAAFTFSIFPYGSTNFVITDVIEGSSEAVVGPGTHQLLFSNVGGKKAPFTASRAAERPDLTQLEAELRSKGMDVDVQRYYLIQIPLQSNTRIQPSNMGTPPLKNFYKPMPMSDGAVGAGAPDMEAASVRRKGLEKVAIGHGEVEGEYSRGSGFEGMRAEEPIRVTVVYFVTPVGEVTQADMESFTKAFSSWDEQAIWGGSFVVDKS